MHIHYRIRLLTHKGVYYVYLVYYDQAHLLQSTGAGSLSVPRIIKTTKPPQTWNSLPIFSLPSVWNFDTVSKFNCSSTLV